MFIISEVRVISKPSPLAKRAGGIANEDGKELNCRNFHPSSAPLTIRWCGVPVKTRTRFRDSWLIRSGATLARISALPLLVVTLSGWFPAKDLEPGPTQLWPVLGAVVGLFFIVLGFVGLLVQTPAMKCGTSRRSDLLGRGFDPRDVLCDSSRSLF